MPIHRPMFIDLGPGHAIGTGRRRVHRKRRHHVGGLMFNPVAGIVKGLTGLLGLGHRRHVAAGRRHVRRRAILI